MKCNSRQRRKKERPEICPVCDQGFDYQANLKKHLIARHPEVISPEERKRVSCELCPRTYARRDHMLKHMTKAHGRQKTRRGTRRSSCETRWCTSKWISRCVS